MRFSALLAIAVCLGLAALPPVSAQPASPMEKAASSGLAFNKRLVVFQAVSRVDFDITFVMGVANLTSENIGNLSVQMDFANAFAGAGGFEVQSFIVDYDLVLNPAFDGGLDTELIAPGGILLAGEKAEFTVVVRLTRGDNPGPFFCSSIAAGTDAMGMTVSDVSQDGLNPDPDGNGDPGDNSEPTEIVLQPLRPECSEGVVYDDDTVESAFTFGNKVVSTRALQRFDGVGGLFVGQICVCWTRTFSILLDQPFEIVFYTVDPVSGEPGSLLDAVAVTAQDVPLAPEVKMYTYDLSGLNLRLPAGNIYIGMEKQLGSGSGLFCGDDDGYGMQPLFGSNDEGSSWQNLRPLRVALPVRGIFHSIPRLAVTKALTEVTEETATAYQLTFEMRLSNLGTEALDNLSVVVDLDTAFAAAAGFEVLDLVADGGLAVNPGYDGTTQKELLAPGNALAVGAERVLTLVVLLESGGNPGPYSCSAVASATAPDGTVVVDTSQNGTEPDPDGDGDAGNNSEPTEWVLPLTNLVVPALDRVGLLVLLGLLAGAALWRLRR